MTTPPEPKWEPLIENPEVRWPGPTNGVLPPYNMTHPKCAGCGEYLGLRPHEWFCHKNRCDEKKGAPMTTPQERPSRIFPIVSLDNVRDLEDRLMESKAEAERLEEESAICRDAIEDCVRLVNDWYEGSSQDDSDAACQRAMQRKLSEAIGKACPRLLMERPEGQSIYGLRWRELLAERDLYKSKYEELCKDVAEWHPMDECAQEIQALRAQVAELKDKLADLEMETDVKGTMLVIQNRELAEALEEIRDFGCSYEELGPCRVRYAKEPIAWCQSCTARAALAKVKERP